MHQLFVSLFAGRPSLCIPISVTTTPVDSAFIHASIADAAAIPQEHLRIATANGSPLPEQLSLRNGEHTFLSANLRLLGGKGGFGSMLRAQGGRMASQKTTNFEACRDLTGRRLKTVNEAKKLAVYLENEPERQKVKEQKLREKIEKGLKVPEPKKHRFDDPKYFEQTTEMGDDVSTAVLKVLKKSKSASTASAVTVKASSSSLGIWDDDISSDEDENDEEETDGSECEKASNSNRSSGSPPTEDSEVERKERKDTSSDEKDVKETPNRKRKLNT